MEEHQCKPQQQNALLNNRSNVNNVEATKDKIKLRFKCSSGIVINHDKMNYCRKEF
jgi:hypothetical protein